MDGDLSRHFSRAQPPRASSFCILCQVPPCPPPRFPQHLPIGSWELWEDTLTPKVACGFLACSQRMTTFLLFLVLQRMFQMEGNAPIGQGKKLRLGEGRSLA